MSTDRPALQDDGLDATAAEAVVANFVDALQRGIDNGDADTYNRDFAADVFWGTPFGEHVDGYDTLHRIHTDMLPRRITGPASRYEAVRVTSPASNIVVADVRRTSLDAEGQPVPTTNDLSRPFSEVATYVLVRRDDTWWLAAGQNTIIQPKPSAPR